jgi:hypothetical protein
MSRYRNVLDYLRDMAEYSRLSHRHDLQDNYNDAWSRPHP